MESDLRRRSRRPSGYYAIDSGRSRVVGLDAAWLISDRRGGRLASHRPGCRCLRGVRSDAGRKRDSPREFRAPTRQVPQRGATAEIRRQLPSRREDLRRQGTRIRHPQDTWLSPSSSIRSYFPALDQSPGRLGHSPGSNAHSLSHFTAFHRWPVCDPRLDRLAGIPGQLHGGQPFERGLRGLPAHALALRKRRRVRRTRARPRRSRCLRGAAVERWKRRASLVRQRLNWVASLRGRLCGIPVSRD